MQNLKDYFVVKEDFVKINPFVRHVNKIIINEWEKHCCPLRQLYDYQLVVMLKGELKFKIESSEVSIKAGDCLIIPPFVSSLEYTSDDLNDSHLYFIVHFDFFYQQERRDWNVEDMYLKYCRPWIKNVEPDPRYVDKTGINSHVLTGFVLFENRLYDEMLGDLQNMVNIYRYFYPRERSDNDELRLRAYFVKILSCFCEDPNKKSCYSETVNRFIEYVSVNYKAEINMSEIVQSYGYTINYYRKIFKEQTGVTPAEYLLDVRMKKAKELLMYNNAVNKVAEKVGFPDPYYFSKVFKKTTGLSPKEYKKAIQKDNS